MKNPIFLSINLTKQTDTVNKPSSCRLFWAIQTPGSFLWNPLSVALEHPECSAGTLRVFRRNSEYSIGTHEEYYALHASKTVVNVPESLIFFTSS